LPRSFVASERICIFVRTAAVTSYCCCAFDTSWLRETLNARPPRPPPRFKFQRPSFM
jgi:hypothetical protein